MIQKSLQQLNEEAKSSGQSKKLSSNLEEILKEMEEVVADIRSNNVDDELLQKQEHILSKLLDAQRSINERDYEKERESFAGQNFQRETPPELMLSTEEGLQKLRDELLNSSKEGYKKDYEELIRKYFEALQKEQLKN
jgi:predicted metal-dependent hydrolase